MAMPLGFYIVYVFGGVDATIQNRCPHYHPLAVGVLACTCSPDKWISSLTPLTYTIYCYRCKEYQGGLARIRLYTTKDHTSHRWRARFLYVRVFSVKLVNTYLDQDPAEEH